MTLFTPNILRGKPHAGRYAIYRRGDRAFSVTPDGEIFDAIVRRDACGACCRCGAFVEPTEARGKLLLASASKFED